MAKEKAADLSTTGVMSRSPEDIARVLSMLLERGQAVNSDLAGGKIVFESRLLYVDPARAYVMVEPGANEPALTALLERPRASFHASPEGWHIEFAAAGAQRAEHEGQAAIRLRFPEILITHQRRARERLRLESQVPLHFVVDAGGPLSFDGTMVDVSIDGLGILQYGPGITLEPGTLLKGCRIDLPRQPLATVEMEVRYSRQATLPDGRRVVRSGCRFVNLAPEFKAALEAFFKR